MATPSSSFIGFSMEQVRRVPFLTISASVKQPNIKLIVKLLTPGSAMKENIFSTLQNIDAGKIKFGPAAFMDKILPLVEAHARSTDAEIQQAARSILDKLPKAEGEPLPTDPAAEQQVRKADLARLEARVHELEGKLQDKTASVQLLEGENAQLKTLMAKPQTLTTEQEATSFLDKLGRLQQKRIDIGTEFVSLDARHSWLSNKIKGLKGSIEKVKLNIEQEKVRITEKISEIETGYQAEVAKLEAEFQAKVNGDPYLKGLQGKIADQENAGKTVESDEDLADMKNVFTILTSVWQENNNIGQSRLKAEKDTSQAKLKSEHAHLDAREDWVKENEERVATLEAELLDVSTRKETLIDENSTVIANIEGLGREIQAVCDRFNGLLRQVAVALGKNPGQKNP